MTVVVAALLWDKGKLLIQTRPEGKHLAGKWEFPGGKLERGESPEQALERELWEELGIRTRTGSIRQVVNHSYPEKDVLLLFYESSLLKGVPCAKEGQRLAWASTEELSQYDFAPADIPVLDVLAKQAVDDI